MERKLLKKLKEWQKKPGRKPLVLEGARQVGKTYLLQRFGENCFKNVVYINLELPDSDIDEMLSDSLDPQKIVDKLSLKYNTKIYPNETLIIFDEVQEKPIVLTLLKYFAEKAPEYCVAVAGSLLGIAIHQGSSFPVGKVDRLHLYPLDFEEFCFAMGLKPQIKAIRQAINAGERPIFTSDFRDAFWQYLTIGGMPAAVFEWLNSKNINTVELILENILADYKADFGKHASAADAQKIAAVWDSVPAQFAKDNHKFTYKAVNQTARGRDFEFAFSWLESAGLVYKVSLVPAGDKLPLKAYANQKDFKVYVLDVGLLRVLSRLPSSVVIGEDDVWSQFGGVFAEQFVLQQIIAETKRSVYYWVGGSDNESSPKTRSEVDFVTSRAERIIPIEVKSGTNVKAKSLKIYRGKYQPALSIRFSLLDLDYNEGLLNIPLYYSFLFNELLDISAKNVGKLAVFSAKKV
jgi:predicted AAA+ superfamily ATPase